MSRVLVAVLLLTLAFSVQAREVLRLHGSNTLGETLAPAWVEAWFEARGMGGSAPLASDSGDAGRHRNRRVEVWIDHAAP